MDVARDLVGVVHVLAGGYVTVEVVLMIARFVTRAISEAGR